MKPPLPSSDGFWILSWASRDAADATFTLIRGEDYCGLAVLPCVFLYFRSVELALKSVLVHHGVKENEIARILGHRLTALLRRVEGFVVLSLLGIATSDRQLLDRYSADYSEKWFEYPDDDSVDYPPLETLRDLSHCVVDATRIYGRDRA